MRKRKVIPALVLVLVLLCGITIGASAASTLQEIKAYLNAGITVDYKGEAQTMLDGSGNRVYPITYNDTNYLPIRPLSEMLGLGVEWDEDTQTIYLSEKQSGVDLIDTYKAYYISTDSGQVQTADKQKEDISGISCDHWLWFYCGGYARSRWASFNLQGKHDTLTFSYYADRDTTLTVLGDDDNVLGEYAITGGAVAQTVTIPLFQTNELKFQMELSGNLKIFNAYLDVEE